jgi:cbb3-type cytochrome oxidase maturation protein
MSVLVILILASLVIALSFLAGFIWAVRSGQFEDTCTPSMRVLTEEVRCQTFTKTESAQTNQKLNKAEQKTVSP